MLGKHALAQSCLLLVPAYASLSENASLYDQTSLYNNTAFYNTAFLHDKAFVKHCFVMERSDAKRVGCDHSATQRRPTKSSVALPSRRP